MKETEIIIKVRLDSNNIPEEIYWSAPDGGMKDQQSKAILLSFWDSAKKETLKMDLWTKEMQIDEMKSFMLQTFISMKKSISKATGDEDLVNLVDDFCVEFEKRVSEKNQILNSFIDSSTKLKISSIPDLSLDDVTYDNGSSSQ